MWGYLKFLPFLGKKPKPFLPTTAPSKILTLFPTTVFFKITFEPIEQFFPIITLSSIIELCPIKLLLPIFTFLPIKTFKPIVIDFYLIIVWFDESI